jgi:CheY-like chemotaxis protein
MALTDVLIIAMTASVMMVDVEQLKAAGFSGLLGKPIRNRTFPEMLERILEGDAVWYIS